MPEMPRRAVFSPEQTWALVFFVLMQFVAVVWMTSNPLIGGGNFPEYIYNTFTRSLLELLLFFGLFLWFAVPRQHRAMALNALLMVGMAALVCHFTWMAIAEPGLEWADDRDSALEVAGSALLRGSFPYHEKTFLSYPLSPLSTPILMALPTVAIWGQAELITPLVLLAVFLLVRWQHRRVDCALPLPVFAALIVLSPLAMEELLIGRDLIWAMPWLLAAFFLLDRERLIAASIFLGIGICTRTALFFIIPVWCVYLFRGWDKSKVEKSFLALILTVVALELPFFLWNPKGFFAAPMMISVSKISNEMDINPSIQSAFFNGILPDSSARVSVIIAMLLAISGWLGWSVRNPSQLALAMAAVLGFAFVFTGSMMRLEYLCWPMAFFLVAMVGHRSPDIDPRKALPESASGG